MTADPTPTGPSWLDRAAEASLRVHEAKAEPLTVREHPATPLLGYESLTWRALHITEGTTDRGEPLPAGWSVIAETPGPDGDEAVIWLHVLDAATPDDQAAHQQVAQVAAQALAGPLAEALRQEQLRHQLAEREVGDLRAELDATLATLTQATGERDAANAEVDRLMQERGSQAIARARDAACDILADILDPRRREEQELTVRGIRQDGAILHGTAAEWADWTSRAEAAGASIPTEPAVDTTARPW